MSTPPASGPALPAGMDEALNSFDQKTRRDALMNIAALSPQTPSPTGWVNNHAHTFYSYCSMNLSPYGLVWEAARRGLSVIGSTDFDVLDAMDEMYEAGDTLRVKTTVSLETRAYANDFASVEINSPGEPGVIYVMGVGFAAIPADPLFATLAERSRRRNEEMVGKINPALSPAAIDYQTDVLPLTPNNNATERHVCEAYDEKARACFPDADALVQFWMEKLGLPQEKAATLVNDTGALRNAIRAKFMKQGGIGYAAPDRESFPAVEDFFRMVDAAGAVPCLAWLDGLSAGEAQPEQLLDAAIGWGAGAVNIIPERNWNFPDPDVKKRKLAALEHFVHAARARHLPIIAGTELNGPGQKFVDSFDAPELQPYVGDFQTGALWLYGHTCAERAAGKGARSEWAKKRFGNDRAASDAFYADLGKTIHPGTTLEEMKKYLPTGE